MPTSPSPAEAVESAGHATTNDALKAFMEKAQEQVLPVTYWFEPEPRAAAPYPVTVRFTGRRKDIDGKPQRRDRFVHDEVIPTVMPGSGPISITALVADVHPGEWEVSAEILRQSQRTGRQADSHLHDEASSAPDHTHPVAQLWQRYVPSVNSGQALKTCPTPFAVKPGAVPLSWFTMVVLGMILALVAQALIVPRVHLNEWTALLTTVGAIVVGIAGAKIWYVVKHRSEHLIDGWCIQGFITGAAIAGIALFALLRAPVGPLLDASTPGLLLGLCVGRVGCYFAGCCGGPPTAARWGIWSSDQRVGARRVPTQLMESAFSLLLAIIAAVAVLAHGPRDGAYLVAAVAAYTLGREVLLDLRLEKRQKIMVGNVPVVAPVATLVLLGALVFIAI